MTTAREWQTLAIIVAGGAVGSLCRHLLTQVLLTRPDEFNVRGTLLVNIIGCLLLGFLSAGRSELWPSSRYAHALLVTGFLGGFTTFSHYITQIRDLIVRDLWPFAVGYALGSILVGWLAIWAGGAAGHVLFGRVRR